MAVTSMAPPVLELRAQDAAQPQYAPLVLPQAGVVSKVIARAAGYRTSGEMLKAFILVVGDGIAVIELVYQAPDASVVLGAEDLADLVEKVAKSWESNPGVTDPEAIEGCENLVVGYRLMARTELDPWVEYAHGPLTLECPNLDDLVTGMPPVGDKNRDSSHGRGSISTGVDGGPDGRGTGGKFEGPFDAGFMSATGEQA